MNSINGRPRLVGLLAMTALGGIFAYLRHHRLAQWCRRISITELPQASACRKLVKRTREQISHPAWGMECSTILSSWSGQRNGHWVSSFTALQIEVPVSLVLGYTASRDTEDMETSDDAYSLIERFLAAFLNARATRPEAFVMDKEVPPFSLELGSLLFGRQSGLGAFLLGTWETADTTPIQPSDLPSNAPLPCTEFPSNKGVTYSGETDTAGAVMYWKFPAGLVRASDYAASLGLPWRLMEGGF